MTESQLEEEMRNIWNKTKETTAINRHLAYGVLLEKIKRELKRCYDLIDAQKENLEFLNGAIEKLHEETWTEAVVEFVEEHHPSEWCDYSHCWKCEEETTSE